MGGSLCTSPRRAFLAPDGCWSGGVTGLENACVLSKRSHHSRGGGHVLSPPLSIGPSHLSFLWVVWTSTPLSSRPSHLLSLWVGWTSTLLSSRTSQVPGSRFQAKHLQKKIERPWTADKGEETLVRGDVSGGNMGGDFFSRWFQVPGSRFQAECCECE